MAVLQKVRKGPPLVKDKGFAWVVLLMSFLSHTVNIGFSYAVVGNLTIEHKNLFGISLQKSSLIGSIHIGLLCMFAPLVSIIVKLLGYQLTQIVGGVCMVLAIGLSTLTTQYWHALLLFGILGGLGISITYTTSSAILAFHFERYKYFAFSAATMGFYAGVTFWPIVSQKLFDKFDYSVAMGIMAGPQAVHIIAGFLYFQPTNVPREEAIQDGKLSETDVSRTVEGHENLALDCSQTTPANDSGLAVTSSATEEVEDISMKAESNTVATGKSARAVKEEFMTYLKSYQIWLLLLHCFLWGGNFTSFYVLVNDIVVHQTGASEKEIAFGITIVGISNIAGCLMVISTSSLNYNRLIAQMVYIMSYGICTIIIALSTNKMMFYILCALWGVGTGSSIANLLATVNEFCDAEQIATLFGLTLLTEGAGGLLGTSLCSYVADNVSALAAMMLSGSLGVAGSCCLIPYIIQKFRNRKQPQSDEPESKSTDDKLENSVTYEEEAEVVS